MRIARSAAVMVAVGLVVGGGSVAAAEPGPDHTDNRSALTPFAEPSTDLRRSSSSGEAVTEGTFPSPSQCRGKSNSPHKASSTVNAVKGFAETSCVANVPYLDVTTTVWRHRWWGYEQVGSTGFNSETNWYYQGASAQYSPCQVNTWRTVGNHVAKDIDSEWYSGETLRYADVTC